MITAGTTTSLIPRFLVGRQGVNIVTNSTLLLPYVRNNPGLSVTLTGGEFRPASEALIGPATIRELGQFHVSKAFLGSDGISLKKGITADSADLADVCRRMSEQARQTIVLADSSKLGRVGFAHIMPASLIDILITDAGAPAAEIDGLRKKGVDVRLV
jgi:DeoR family galactitol utilization operon repressor